MGKTLDEVRKTQQNFLAQFPIDTNSDMNGVGIGKDDQGNHCLRAYFKTEAGRKASSVPGEFEGVKVVTMVIGEMKAQ